MRFFCFLFVVCCAATASAEEVVVDVTGAVHPSGDPALTLRRAREDARRLAVIAVLEPRPLVGRLVGVADEIAAGVGAHPAGVVVEENFGAPVVRSDGVVEQKLHARYDLAGLQQHVCAAVRGNHDPSVSVVLLEPSTAAALGAVHDVVDAFGRACFRAIDHDVVVADGPVSPATLDMLVKYAAAQWLVLLTTKGAWTTLKVVNTSTNEIEAVATGVPAKAVDEVLRKMVQRWEEGGDNSAWLSVVVQGNVSKAALAALLDALDRWPSKPRVVVRVSKAGVTTLDVIVDGGAEVFAERLDTAVVGAFVVEIIEVSRGKVILKLNAKAKKQ